MRSHQSVLHISFLLKASFVRKIKDNEAMANFHDENENTTEKQFYLNLDNEQKTL